MSQVKSLSYRFLLDTQYAVVKFIGKMLMKWKLQYEDDQMNWDIFWTDNAVQPEFLAKMHRKFSIPIQLAKLIRKSTTFRGCMRWLERTI